MPLPPNAVAASEDFEFAALEAACHYRAALVREFSRSLRGRVLEVGAGIGQTTKEVLTLPGVRTITCVEPSPKFVCRLRELLPTVQVVEGTMESLPEKEGWDAVLSVNVLEHIENDERELRLYHEALAGQRGCLCLLVPARPELYAPIDKDFGHFRRYTRPELRGKLAAAGFVAERLCYFNLVGWFAWWLTFRMLGRRRFDVASVRLFDSLIFPAMHFLESRVLRPPIGQSLLAVARA